MNFNIGDKVYLPDGIDDIAPGATAIVVYIRSPQVVGIQLDVKDRERHNCGGRGKEGHCWNVPRQHLRLSRPLNPEEAEQQRLNRVLKKIKYLDSKFETEQHIKLLERKVNEEIQTVPLQNAQ